MDFKIIVFVHDKEDPVSAKILKIFTDLEFATFADGIHGKEYDWLKANIKQGRLFVFADDSLHMFEICHLEKDMIWTPDFAFVFNDDRILDNIQWMQLHQYLEEHLNDSMIDMTNAMKVEELLKKPSVMKATIEEPTYAPNQQNYYSFQRVFLEDRDIMLYEVIKPFTDLPYTSVTRHYSQKGHLPFFTDLFICQSWGVARADIKFLEEMWKELQMDGEFNLDHLLKNATEACYPAENTLPAPEPEVYRKNIYDTINVLKEKEMGKARRNVSKYID